MAKAATLRSAPAIEVAMLRSGRVLQRSKNRFDSPMATKTGPVHSFNLGIDNTTTTQAIGFLFFYTD